MALLIKGIVVGFSIAAPVGPIGILCIRRTLAEGRWTGLAVGLGAATADALYGCIAGLGLSYISKALLSMQSSIQVLGGLFLLYLGFKSFTAKPEETESELTATSIPKAFGSTLLLTLTNPATILAFTALFASIGLGEVSKSATSSLVFVLGVFCGSAGWWLLLTGGVSLFRKKVTLTHRLWINRISGTILTLFALTALLPTH